MQIFIRTAVFDFLRFHKIAFRVGLWAILWGVSVTCWGEEPPHSNSVEVSGTRYTIVNKNRALYLQSESTSGSGEVSSAPITGIPRQSSPIAALKLGRWWKSGLALVYATKSEENYHYTLAVFPSVESQRIVPTVWEKEFLKSNTRYHFIALEGQFSGDSIVVVLGRFRDENGVRKFSQGYVYNNECPQPPEIFSITPIGND